jgi:hypothetical protein
LIRELHFINGGDGTYAEEDISNLEDFVQSYVKPEHVPDVMNRLYEKLQYVTDYKGIGQEVLTRKTMEQGNLTENNSGEFIYDPSDDNVSITFNKDITSKLEKGNGNFTVPGVILSSDSNVLRTDGIVVEAILGKGNALEKYGQELQAEEVAGLRADTELKNSKTGLINLQEEILSQEEISKGQQLKGLENLSAFEPKYIFRPDIKEEE